MVVLVVAVAALLAVAAGCSDPDQAPLPKAGETAVASAPDSAAPNSGATSADQAVVAGDGSRAKPAVDPGYEDMASISDGLGYTLVPARLPLDFTLVSARLVDIPSEPLATVFYANGSQRLSLFYPATFIPDFGERTPNAGTFSPPEDAVVRVVVGGDLAYPMKGEWDERTVQLLASYTAQWEYNGRLTLYFEYEVEPGQRQWAMLSANTQRDSWLGVGGLIDIAGSMVAVR